MINKGVILLWKAHYAGIGHLPCCCGLTRNKVALEWNESGLWGRGCKILPFIPSAPCPSHTPSSSIISVSKERTAPRKVPFWRRHLSQVLRLRSGYWAFPGDMHSLSLSCQEEPSLHLGLGLFLALWEFVIWFITVGWKW